MFKIVCKNINWAKRVMRILKRSSLIYNEVIFVILSMVYLHISFSLDADISAIDFKRLTELVIGLPALTFLSIVAIISIMLVKRISIYLLSLLTLLVFYKSFSTFLLSYDKILLVMNVAYMIVSYNMILLLREELSLAIYKPGYMSSSIEVENYKSLRAIISNGNGSFEGNITNMDKWGIVLKLDDPQSISGSVDVCINFEGNEFHGRGILSTKFDTGYGVKLLTSKKTPSVLDWKDLYNIFYRRGYKI
mgnify:FL=1